MTQLNENEEMGHSCRTPLVALNEYVFRHVLLRDYRYARKKLTDPPGMLFWWRTPNSAIRSSKSKASLKSRNSTIIRRQCVWRVSKSWPTVEIWSIQHQPGQNPSWSVQRFLLLIGVRWRSVVEVKTLINVESKRHKLFFPGVVGRDIKRLYQDISTSFEKKGSLQVYIWNPSALLSPPSVALDSWLIYSSLRVKLCEQSPKWIHIAICKYSWKIHLVISSLLFSSDSEQNGSSGAGSSGLGT